MLGFQDGSIENRYSKGSQSQYSRGTDLASARISKRVMAPMAVMEQFFPAFNHLCGNGSASFEAVVDRRNDALAACELMRPH